MRSGISGESIRPTCLPLNKESKKKREGNGSAYRELYGHVRHSEQSWAQPAIHATDALLGKDPSQPIPCVFVWYAHHP
jgi:hypothetical protein